MLHPLALLLSLIYVHFYGKRTHGREGGVILSGEDEGLHHNSVGHPQQNREVNGGEGAQRREAREVDAEALWE